MTTNSELQKRRDAAVVRGVSNILATVYTEHARNAELWDVEGKRYIDFASGIAVLNVGHNHPKVIAAVKAQLDKFCHTCFQVTPYESYVALAEKLNRIVPCSGTAKTIFLTTGAEAVKKQLKVGNGLEEGVSQGPMIDMKAVEKVEEHIKDAVGKGAKVALGGKRHALGGTYFEPTILTGVTSDMVVANDETFGPLAPLFRFKTEEDAIRMANDTEFGLAAYYYTGNLGRAWRVGEALEYGMVGLNTGILSTEVAPFGGMKSSGIGREGSKYGMDEYLEIKYWCIGEVDA